MSASRFRGAAFGDHKDGLVKDLPGFNKQRGHFVPDRMSSAAAAFIAQIGAELIKEEAGALFDTLKAGLAYNRRDIQIEHENGSALVTSKHFTLSAGIGQHPEKPAYYRRTILIEGFTDPEIIMDPRFNEAFLGTFSFLRVDLGSQQDVEGLIDLIEGGSRPGITCTYPRDASEARIAFTDRPGTLVVGPSWIRLDWVNRRPADLVQALLDILSAEFPGSTPAASLLG